ncbi:MAG TPA: aldo/keto reductase [Sphingomicrobium sp.]|jgi:D-threo-aldose 1-dehydrogenase|nr:aldo/keto reductase [Sphingomicrobium sp.]
MNGALPVRTLGRSGLEVTALGLGTAPLGNLYRTVADAVARETLDTATELGIRYFDTAPYYGFGLSELRVGDAVRGHSGIVISTKAGRLLKPAPHVDTAGERHGFLSPMPFEPEFDYSHDGILRSHEQSLQRLGLARIDVLLIHDIGRQTHGEAHAGKLAQLIDGGGLKALRRLRDEGTVAAIGIGVNEVEICLDLMDRAELDVLLLAGRYTLLEQGAIDELLPRCTKESVSVVIGGPFNSGILATGASASATPRYNYSPAPAPIRERASHLEAVCTSHGVPLVAAALQFPIAHPAVSSVIPGFASAAEVRSGVEHFQTPIPDALWADLQSQGLIDSRAPLPGAQVEAAAQ